MSTETTKKQREPGYSLQSVEKSAPPQGMQEGEWHTYTLVRGESEIKGVRFDTFKAVTEHGKELAEKINLRNNWNTSHYSAQK